MQRISRQATRLCKTILRSVLGISVLVLTGSLSSVGAQVTNSSTEVQTETITLKIDGWTCRSCEKDIRKVLLAVPGVKAIDVSYAHGGAVVTVEHGRVSSNQLVQAVEKTSTRLSTYRAQVIPNGSLPEASDGTGSLTDLFKGLFK